MGIRVRSTSPRSPGQNPYAERLIGTLRRDCLDYVLIFSERHLRQMLTSYFSYYNETRTHLSLDKRERSSDVGPPCRARLERACGRPRTIARVAGRADTCTCVRFLGRRIGFDNPGAAGKMLAAFRMPMYVGFGHSSHVPIRSTVIAFVPIKL
jgi:hypothetical protein